MAMTMTAAVGHTSSHIGRGQGNVAGMIGLILAIELLGARALWNHHVRSSVMMRIARLAIALRAGRTLGRQCDWAGSATSAHERLLLLLLLLVLLLIVFL